MHVVQTTDLTNIYHNRYIALNALNLRAEKGRHKLSALLPLPFDARLL